MSKPTRTARRAERCGRWLGHRRVAFRRWQARRIGWAMGQGLPFGIARAILWIVQAALLFVLLSALVWIAPILGLCLFAVGYGTVCSVLPEEAGQWRDGDEGFGYYENHVRVDHGHLWDREH